jgi:hypothetical protein
MDLNGKELRTSKIGIYGGGGAHLEINGREWQTISKIIECNDPIPIPMKKDDSIVIRATYDTYEHPP